MLAGGDAVSAVYSMTGPSLLAVGLKGGRTHYVEEAEYERSKTKREVKALCGTSPATEVDAPKRWSRRQPGGSAVCNHCHAVASRLRATVRGG